MPKSKRSKGRKGGSRNPDQTIINSHKATGSTTNMVTSDMTFSRQNFNIIQRPPKNFLTMTYWAEISYDVILASSSSGPTEQNVYFAASSFPEFTDFSSCFDQYCIYSVTATYVNISGGVQRLLTAIDFDSVDPKGKTGIQGFASYNLTVFSNTGGTSLVRYLKPCIAPQVTSSNLPVAGGIARAWLDVGYANVQHYGLRQLVDQSTNGSSVINASYTAVFGFRNNF